MMLSCTIQFYSYVLELNFLSLIAEKLRDAKEENIKIHATLDQTLSELNSF